MADQPQPRFAIQRVYLKDASFESPASPVIFKSQWKPQIKVDLNTRTGEKDGLIYEVMLTVTVTATQDEKTGFLCEVQQAGLFEIEGLEGEQLQQVLAIACPNLLFPYAKEALDSMILKGGFPGINLQPVNFEALFNQARQQASEQADKVTTH